MPTRPLIGILDTDLETNHFYMNDIMHCFNSNARKVTSYKYAFFKCILDNLFNSKLDNDYYYLSFQYLSYSFSKIYWNLASKHNVPQIQNGRKNTMVEKYEGLKKNPIYKIEGVDFDVVDENVKNKYLKATANQITKDVLWALYTDFNCHIYGYDVNKKIIYFSKESFRFLSDYKDVLEKLDYYAWIKWTENILSISHRSISNLSKKLDEEPERIALERFKKELLKKGDSLLCFYCEKDLLNDKIHLDHFIPWSFIKDNQTWNFVFSCAVCNTAKNNRIPNKKYLLKLIERNRQLLGNTYEDSLNKAYDAALHNGFVLWEKK